MTSENPYAGQGPVLLDIGDDVGALVVTMPADLEGVEVEINRVGDDHRHPARHRHDHHHRALTMIMITERIAPTWPSSPGPRLRGSSRPWSSRS